MASSPPADPPSTRRTRQAEQTRQEILAAARRRFADDGYAPTSVKDIAAEAGVSVQTVYDSVGSKADLVRQLNDHLDVEAGIPQLAQRIPTETDPTALLAIASRIATALVEHCGDILRATASGAASEPALRAVTAEGRHRHRAGITMLTERLRSLDALRADLSVEQAAGTIAVLTDDRLALMLADDFGWTLAHIEAWMTDTLVRSVLEPPAPR